MLESAESGITILSALFNPFQRQSFAEEGPVSSVKPKI